MGWEEGDEGGWDAVEMGVGGEGGEGVEMGGGVFFGG